MPTRQAILAAAAKVQAPYILGSKVLLLRVADELGLSLADLAPALVALHKAGELRLVRVDLVQAFDRVKGTLRRSWVDQPGGSGGGWDALDLSA